MLISTNYALQCTHFHERPLPMYPFSRKAPSNVPIFTEDQTLKRHCTEILHTEMHPNWMKNEENMGKISLMHTRKVSVSLHHLSQNSANIKETCQKTWPTSRTILLYWISPKLDTKYWKLRDEIHLAPKVKYDYHCTDLQETHTW
jgi:hypothetical protein